MDILKKIIATKHEEIALAKTQVTKADLIEQIKQRPASSYRGFKQALMNKAKAGLPGIIAEVKKASPSKGLIRPDFDPKSIAQAYEKDGAACLSVLTDEQYFQGSPKYLQTAKAACSLPILRKDFIVDEYQVYQAAAWGADAILLIAAELDIDQLKGLAQLAQNLSMDVLIESHNAEELHKAVQVPNAVIGINNRNLRNFTVDLHTTTDLLSELPADTVVVTESGIRTREDVQFMRDNGVHCFLVGEAFMREPDPGKALKELFFQ